LSKSIDSSHNPKVIRYELNSGQVVEAEEFRSKNGLQPSSIQKLLIRKFFRKIGFTHFDQTGLPISTENLRVILGYLIFIKHYYNPHRPMNSIYDEAVLKTLTDSFGGDPSQGDSLRRTIINSYSLYVYNPNETREFGNDDFKGNMYPAAGTNNMYPTTMFTGNGERLYHYLLNMFSIDKTLLSAKLLLLDDGDVQHLAERLANELLANDS
jgi:hypothetical protein